MSILVNGQPGDSISVTDRGLMYGDGVFRTMPARQGVPLGWARQWRKLAADCAALAIPVPNENALRDEVASLLADTPDCAVKIVITRGEGQRGYAPPDAPVPSRIVMTAPLPAYPEHYAREGVAVHLCETRLGYQPRLAGIKHLNRLENVLARMEWDDPAVAEGLLRDEAGNVVEGVMSNLFVCHNNTLLTPDLSRCGVAGVTRERVLEWASCQGVAVEVRNLSLEEVQGADEAFLCNSLIGIWPVRKLADREWCKGPLTAALQDDLQQQDD
jgi:4-amino-4-deoxychorismate lyase